MSPGRGRSGRDAEVRQALGSKSSDRPRLLVVGSDELRVARVARRLEPLKARIERLSWEQTLDALAGDVFGVVLVLPIRRVAMGTAIEIIHDHPDGKAVPVYGIVPDGTSSRRIRGLYRAGASVVFEWPREVRSLTGVFAESLGMTLVRGRSSRADNALARSVRAHLRIYPELDTGRLRILSQKGLITLSGQVQSLARRQRIIDIVAAVPGVRAVISQALRVAPTGIPDAKLKRRARGLLNHALDLDASTISIEVSNGYVNLTGTVSDAAELQRLEELITHLKGSRGLETRLSVSPVRQEHDRRLTLRYRKALETLYPKERVSVIVVEGVAILSGKVRTLSIKRSMTRLLAREAALRSVVNKIEIK